jgi:outer membrane protein insertion porin family
MKKRSLLLLCFLSLTATAKTPDTYSQFFDDSESPQVDSNESDVFVEPPEISAPLKPRPPVFKTQKLKAIHIKGNHRIATEAILSYIPARVGDTLTSTLLDQSLKDIFKTGLFEDIKIAIDNKKESITITVIENPSVNQVAFEGNIRYKDDELLKEITLKPRFIYTQSTVRQDVETILNMYKAKGRYSVTVTPKLIRRKQNRVDVVFEIDEAQHTPIRQIHFVGNQFLTDNRLGATISSRESKWYRFLSIADRYDPARLAHDEGLILKEYSKYGFIRAKVTGHHGEMPADRNGFNVTYTIEEGDRFTLKSTDITTSVKDLDITPYKKILNLKSNRYYNQVRADEVVDKMTDRLHRDGWGHVEVLLHDHIDDDGKTVDLVFHIAENRRLIIERIDIEGNFRTMDHVIRRKLLLAEGDVMNPSLLGRSKTELDYLDYFSQIEFDQKPGSGPDKVVIVVKVEEKRTAGLELSAGFGPDDGMLGKITFKEPNFMGRGQTMASEIVLAQRRRSISGSFTEPYFMDRPLSLTVSAHRSRATMDQRSSRRSGWGVGLGLGYEISENWRHNFGYNINITKLKLNRTPAEKLEETLKYSPLILEDRGSYMESSLYNSFSYDTRNRLLNPNEGYHLSLSKTFTGVGGSVKYFKAIVNASSHFEPIIDGIVALSGSAGWITPVGSKELRIWDRFNIGGPLMGGFEYDGIGPRDSVTGESLGGSKYARAKLDVSYPIGFAPKDFNLRAHTFMDVGSVWGTDGLLKKSDNFTEKRLHKASGIRLSLGFGLTFNSPMGPLRLDYAHPLISDRKDQKQRFHLQIAGRLF